MARYAGAILATGEPFQNTSGRADNYHPSPQTETTGADRLGLTIGPIEISPPIDLLDRKYSGWMEKSFFGDFYNRIHFLPPSIDLGAVTGQVESELRIWNSYLKSVTLSRVDLRDAAGTSLEGHDLPHTLLPLGTSLFRVRANTDGPPVINAIYDFIFDVTTFPLSVIGARARISPFSPNWRYSYEVEYEFKTEIITSRSGREQRRGLRQSPRKTVSFTATPHHAEMRRLQRALQGWRDNVIVLPELTRMGVLALPSLGNSVTLREAPPSWVQPGLQVVLAHKGRYEAREVASVSGNAVRFTGSSPEQWPAGSKLHPGLAGRLDENIGTRRLTDQVVSASIVFKEDPGTTPVIPAPPAPVVFNGIEAFLTPFNWGDSVTDQYESLREVVDYGWGRVKSFTPQRTNYRVMKVNFLGLSSEKSQALIDFFLRCEGQRKEFYMPTGNADLALTAVGYEGAASIRFAGTDILTDHATDVVNKAIAIYMKTGEVHLHVVTEIAIQEDALGRDTMLRIDPPLHDTISTDSVQRVSWMPVCRHASDTLTVEWVTDTKAQVAMSVRTLENLL